MLAGIMAVKKIRRGKNRKRDNYNCPFKCSIPTPVRQNGTRHFGLIWNLLFTALKVGTPCAVDNMEGDINPQRNAKNCLEEKP
jgi:hypothetical protein